MIVAPGGDRSLLHPVRHETFVVEQGVDAAVEQDALDVSAWHSVVDEGAATGRLVDPGGDLALGRVGRMAVSASRRGEGLGAVVLAELEQQARALGLTGVELHAQAHAVGFYARAGYEVVGDGFVEQGIDHMPMAKVWLPVRPVHDDDALALQALVKGCWDAYDGVLFSLDEEPWLVAPESLRPGYRTWVTDAVDASVAVSPGGELKTLYVSASARRRGLGEALARLAERCGARVLWSDVKFDDAHRLYERLGWVRTGQSRALEDISRTVEWEFRLP